MLNFLMNLNPWMPVGWAVLVLLSVFVFLAAYTLTAAGISLVYASAALRCRTSRHVQTRHLLPLTGDVWSKSSDRSQYQIGDFTSDGQFMWIVWPDGTPSRMCTKDWKKLVDGHKLYLCDRLEDSNGSLLQSLW